MKIFNIESNKVNKNTFLQNSAEEYDVFLLKYN